MNTVSSLLASASLYQTNKTTSSTSTQASATTSSTSSATISTQWGFKVDEDGYFGEDFNAVANIPSNVKINETTLEAVQESLQTIGSTQDPISALSKVWSNFTKIAGSSLDTDGTMTLSQIATMPYSYQTDSSIFGNIVSIQDSIEEYLTVSSTSNDIRTLSNGTLDTGVETFYGLQSYLQNTATTSDLQEGLSVIGIQANEIVANENEVSVGDIFSSFVADILPTGTEKIEATEAYFEFAQSGQDIQSYATNNFGQDFFDEAIQGYGTLPDGSTNNELVDLFLEECNKQIQADAKNYNAALKTNTPQETVANPAVKQYIIYNDTSSSLLSGSLVSIDS